VSLPFFSSSRTARHGTARRFRSAARSTPSLSSRRDRARTRTLHDRRRTPTDPHSASRSARRPPATNFSDSRALPRSPYSPHFTPRFHTDAHRPRKRQSTLEQLTPGGSPRRCSPLLHARRDGDGDGGGDGGDDGHSIFGRRIAAAVATKHKRTPQPRAARARTDTSRHRRNRHAVLPPTAPYVSLPVTCCLYSRDRLTVSGRGTSSAIRWRHLPRDAAVAIRSIERIGAVRRCSPLKSHWNVSSFSFTQENVTCAPFVSRNYLTRSLNQVCYYLVT